MQKLTFFKFQIIIYLCNTENCFLCYSQLLSIDMNPAIKLKISAILKIKKEGSWDKITNNKY